MVNTYLKRTILKYVCWRKLSKSIVILTLLFFVCLIMCFEKNCFSLYTETEDFDAPNMVRNEGVKQQFHLLSSNAEFYDSKRWMPWKSEVTNFEDLQTTLMDYLKNSDKLYSENTVTKQTLNEELTNKIPSAENVTLLKEIPFSNFSYPLDVNLSSLIIDYKERRRHKPINVFPFKFHLLPKQCMFEAPNVLSLIKPFLLFVVKSRPENYENRMAIRMTWASKALFNPEDIKVIFSIGIPRSNRIQNVVKREHAKNNDILQTEFSDSYYNNTYKIIAAVRWIRRHCISAKFIMFVDDDFYISTYNLVKYLNSLKEKDISNIFIGHVIADGKPWRNVNDKWYSSVADYPFDVYPPFCRAGAIITSIELIKKLHVVFQYVKHFRLDDVFLGIVLFKLGIEPQHSELISAFRKPLNKTYVQMYFALHGYQPYEIIHAWKCNVENFCDLSNQDPKTPISVLLFWVLFIVFWIFLCVKFFREAFCHTFNI